MTHLQQAAFKWMATAEQWENAFTTVSQGTLSPGGTTWEGEAAEAAQQRAFADLVRVRVRGLADALHAAAAAARRGADRLALAKSSALDAIANAEEAGFTVGEDLSVTSRRLAGSAGELAALQLRASQLATDIHRRAAELNGLDHAIAAALTEATAPLNDFGFDEAADENVRFVDHHSIKESPPPPGPSTDEPWKDLPSPRTAQEIRDALSQLRRGANKPHRELDTPEEIQDFYDWLTRNAVRDLPGTPFPRKALEDGTEIMLRPDSASGGPTIEAVMPGGGKNPKVHLPLAPFIGEPPQLPPITDASPPPALPATTGGQPVTLPPFSVSDPIGLPPWLIEVGKDTGAGILAGVAIIGSLILSGVTSSGQVAR